MVKSTYNLFYVTIRQILGNFAESQTMQMCNIHTHINTHTHAHTCIHTHACTHMNIHRHTHTHTYTHAHTQTHTHAHTQMQTHTHTSTHRPPLPLHTLLYACAPTHTHTRMHIHACILMYAHKDTHTHTHILSVPLITLLTSLFLSPLSYTPLPLSHSPLLSPLSSTEASSILFHPFLPLSLSPVTRGSVTQPQRTLRLSVSGRVVSPVCADHWTNEAAVHVIVSPLVRQLLQLAGARQVC